MAELEALDGDVEAGEEQPQFAVSFSGEIEYNYSFYFLDCPGEVVCPVILVTQIDSKLLVCVPQSAWHRTPDRRKLPQKALAVPTLVEVSTCLFPQREEELVETVKVWFGFLAPSLEAELRLHGSTSIPDVDVAFCNDVFTDKVPFAGSLRKVAADHFAFLSAESGGDHLGVHAPDGSGAAQMASRMEQLEISMATLSSNVDMIVNKMMESGSLPQTAQEARPSALRKKFKKPTPKSGSSPPPRVRFSGLDPSVVAAATAAGVSEKALEQMQMLVSTSAPAASKLTEAAAKKMQRPVHGLSESEEEEEATMAVQEDVGSPNNMAPIEKAFTQLADILSNLTQDKAAKQKNSKLEAALDSVGASSSGDATALGSGKESSCCSQGPQTSPSGLSKRDLRPHREADAGGSVVTDLGSRDASDRALCPSLGRTQVTDRIVQGAGLHKLVCRWHLGRSDPWPRGLGSSTGVLDAVAAGSGCSRQRELVAGKRVGARDGAPLRRLGSTCRSLGGGGGVPRFPNSWMLVGPR